MGGFSYKKVSQRRGTRYRERNFRGTLHGLSDMFGAADVTTPNYLYLATVLESHQSRDDVKQGPPLVNFSFLMGAGSGGSVVHDSLSIPSHRQ